MTERITRRSLLGRPPAARPRSRSGASRRGHGPFPPGPDAGLRRPDSRPFPHLPAGTPSIPEIEHVVVLMMENHSFDNLLGLVPSQVPGRGRVDGLTVRDGKPLNFNLDAQGHPVYASHATSPCQLVGLPTQAWNASHQSWGNGRNDGFVLASGPVAMEYWDQRDLPFTYSLVRHFPIGQRYFASALAQTYPNRRFFFCGTSSGLVATNLSQTFSCRRPTARSSTGSMSTRSAWRRLLPERAQPAHRPGLLSRPRGARRLKRFDAASTPTPPPAGCPRVHVPGSQLQDHLGGEPPGHPGRRAFHRRGGARAHARPTWKRTALFITYDEHGGYYDHVPPPRAIKPGQRSRRSRCPASPRWPRAALTATASGCRWWSSRRGRGRGYVSSVVQDHTSITAFVERKWNLPAMTFRDANAAPMTDYFDFRRPAFAAGRAGARGRAAARPGRLPAAGLSPPLRSRGRQRLTRPGSADGQEVAQVAEDPGRSCSKRKSVNRIGMQPSRWRSRVLDAVLLHVSGRDVVRAPVELDAEPVLGPVAGRSPSGRCGCCAAGRGAPGARRGTGRRRAPGSTCGSPCAGSARGRQSAWPPRASAGGGRASPRCRRGRERRSGRSRRFWTATVTSRSSSAGVSRGESSTSSRMTRADPEVAVHADVAGVGLVPRPVDREIRTPATDCPRRR